MWRANQSGQLLGPCADLAGWPVNLAAITNATSYNNARAAVQPALFLNTAANS